MVALRDPQSHYIPNHLHSYWARTFMPSSASTRLLLLYEHIFIEMSVHLTITCTLIIAASKMYLPKMPKSSESEKVLDKPQRKISVSTQNARLYFFLFSFIPSRFISHFLSIRWLEVQGVTS